jgi:hypothetical protein
MPWKARLPLALTVTIRDNRLGRDNVDEVAAHIGPGLSTRVRFETGTSDNLSNLMRRLTKHGPHADTEPYPLTFQYTQSALPLAPGESSPSIDLTMLLPLADTTLHTLRFGQGLTRALQVDIARHAAGRDAVQRLGRRSTRRSVHHAAAGVHWTTRPPKYRRVLQRLPARGNQPPSAAFCHTCGRSRRRMGRRVSQHPQLTPAGSAARG